MWLFGYNLRDAGEFQNRLQDSGSKILGPGDVTRLLAANQLHSIWQMEDYEAEVEYRRILREDFCIEMSKLPRYEPNLPDLQKIEGMVIPVFAKLPQNRRVREGERFTPKEVRGARAILIEFRLRPV
jgi:hypothetical protein